MDLGLPRALSTRQVVEADLGLAWVQLVSIGGVDSGLPWAPVPVQVSKVDP